MIPVIEFPLIVQNAARFFSPLFYRRQLKHYKEYVTGLIVSHKYTINTMNSVFMQSNDQSVLNKFLTSSDWDEKSLNDKRLELLQRNRKTQWKHYGIVTIDDTLCHKTGKNIEGVGKFYDHAEHKYVLAHNLVTSHYADNEISYPIDFRLYHKDGSKVAKQYGFRTKIELAIEFVHDCMSRNIPVYTFVFDSWFLCREVAEVIKGYGKAYVAPVKSNRLVIVKGKYIPIKEFAKTIEANCFNTVEIKRKVYRTHTFVTKLSKLGKVRMLISYEKGLKEPVFLVTNELNWEERRILKTYLKRSTIDAFYKEAKQNLGFEGYQVRNLKGIMRHWYLVFVAYSLLKLGAAIGKLGRWIDAKTIGRACRDVIMESLNSFVKWLYEKFKCKINTGGVMEMLILKIAKV